MVSAATTGIPLWLYVFCAMGAGGLLTLLGAVMASVRQWRSHERRVERTCDAVLGQDPDPSVGRYERIPGLIEVIPQIQRAIGTPNGKSVMEHIVEIRKELHAGGDK